MRDLHYYDFSKLSTGCGLTIKRAGGMVTFNKRMATCLKNGCRRRKRPTVRRSTKRSTRRK